MELKRILIFLLVIFLTIIFLFKHPQSLIFPLWIFVYLYKNKFSKMFKGKQWLFIIVGVMFGLIIEVFALLNNADQLVSVRAVTLFHPSVLPDLFLGFFYYLALIVAWYIILRKVNFSVKGVLITAGLFGMVFEQNGAILVGLASGLPGLFVAFFVFLVHGIYPMLAYSVTKNNFSNKRTKAKWWHYFLALLGLYIAWLLIAATIFNFLKPMFG